MKIVEAAAAAERKKVPLCDCSPGAVVRLGDSEILWLVTYGGERPANTILLVDLDDGEVEPFPRDACGEVVDCELRVL